MASPRHSIQDFSVENSFYSGATVSVFVVDENLAKTGTLAALYANPVGNILVSNPILLDSRGRWPQPVYVDQPVIMEISRAGDISETGVVSQANRWRGIWQSGTLYYPGERLRDPTFPRSMVVNAGHTSGVFINDLNAGLLAEEMNLAEETVVMYGAKGDGVTDDSAAILAMQAAVGFIVFAKGQYRISQNITILQPMFFQPGASLLIDAGITVMLRGRHVFADRMQIFQGAGVVRFQGNSTYASGATIFPEWWGQFPRNGDCAPIIQRMSDACSLLTEWHATFLGGVYEMFTGVTLGRGAYLQGLANTRRVVFVRMVATGDMFTLTDTAGRIEGFQFESVGTPTAGANIRVNGADCVIRDISTGGFVGVHVAGNGCVVSDVVRIGSGTTSGPLIVVAASGVKVRNTQGAVNGAAMNAVQIIDGASLVEVTGVETTGNAGVAVRVVSTGFIPSLMISNVRCRNNTVAAVSIECSGAGTCQNVNIDNVHMGPGTVADSACVRLVNTGTGNLFAVMISGLNPRGGAHGIYAERDAAAGVINRVRVSMSDLVLPTSDVTLAGTGAGSIDIVLDSQTVNI